MFTSDGGVGGVTWQAEHCTALHQPSGGDSRFQEFPAGTGATAAGTGDLQHLQGGGRREEAGGRREEAGGTSS